MTGKQCSDCQQTFHRLGRAERCAPCQYNHNLKRQRVRDANRKRKATLNAAPPLPAVSNLRFIYRTDFLLALPAMREELQRQCQDSQTMRMLKDYRGPDPLDLHTLGTSARRRPQKSA